MTLKKVMMTACAIVAMSMPVQAGTTTWGVDWWDGPISQFWGAGDQERGGYNVITVALYSYLPGYGDPAQIVDLDDLRAKTVPNYEDWEDEWEGPPPIYTDEGAIGAVRHGDGIWRPDFYTSGSTLEIESTPDRYYFLAILGGYGTGWEEDNDILLYFSQPILGTDLPDGIPDIFSPPYWVPIPEPSTGLLALAGVGLLMMRRRARKA